jgi:hypothetical protein
MQKGKRYVPDNAPDSQALYSLEICIEISAHATAAFDGSLETDYVDRINL